MNCLEDPQGEKKKKIWINFKQKEVYAQELCKEYLSSSKFLRPVGEEHNLTFMTRQMLRSDRMLCRH